MRATGFPENFIVTNPQFATINWISNNASNNYHSFNAQVTMRPAHGVTWQSTYTWSKNLGINGLIGGGLGTTFTNPADRHKDYAVLPDTRVHDFRTNGTIGAAVRARKAVPRQQLRRAGANRRRLADERDRECEHRSASEHCRAEHALCQRNGRYRRSVRHQLRYGPIYRRSHRQLLLARFRSSRSRIRSARRLQQNLRALCSLSAIADVKTGQVLLQNPLPGTRGTLGQRVLEGPGRWRFDASLSKSIKLTESKTLQFRMDAQNVFNHPEPATGTAGTSLLNMDINNASFGLITGPLAKTNLHREFQAQLRLNF